jgi:hypothetical protein
MKSTLALTAALVALCCGSPVWAAATMHTRVFTGSGTFTVPANIKTTSEFQFTVVGGGGGAGGCHNASAFSSGGGSGAAGFASFSGFNPSDTITITIGTGGTGGNTSGSNGGNGGTSKLTYSGIDVVSGTGGGGSAGVTGDINSSAGAAGTFSATAGATGLTLQSSLDYAAEDGVSAITPPQIPTVDFTVAGGGNPIGHSGTITNHNGALGGGGLGCYGGSATGGAGGSGVVIITWSP